jgi:hypothetical protein
MWGSHGGYYEEYGPLGGHDVLFEKKLNVSEKHNASILRVEE